MALLAAFFAVVGILAPSLVGWAATPTGGIEGRIMAWGSNSQWQLGPGAAGNPTLRPVNVPLDGATAVSAGYEHSAALIKENGTVWAWGTIKNGQLGNGEMCDPSWAGNPAVPSAPPSEQHCGDSYRKEPVQVKEVELDVSKLQPGDGSVAASKSPPQDLTGVVQVSAGHSHTLAVKSDGTVWGWGQNCSNQLGFPKDGFAFGAGRGVTGATTASPYARQVSGLNDIVKVGAGLAHSVALDRSGNLWTWGSNVWGQLGRGPDPLDPEDRRPSRMDNPNATNCTDRFGKQGHPPEIERQNGETVPYPGRAALPSPVVDFAAGSDHTLAMTADGRVWAFGNNCNGQLGPPAPGQSLARKRATPAPVLGLPLNDPVVALGAGGYGEGGHSLALTDRGHVYAWGLADVLGSGQPENVQASPCNLDRVNAHPAPVTVKVSDPGGEAKDLGDVVAVSAGTFTALAIRSDGSVFGWGRPDFEQLGPAGVTQTQTTAVKIPLRDNLQAKMVSARSHTLVLSGTPPGRPPCRPPCLRVPESPEELIEDVDKRLKDINEDIDGAVEDVGNRLDEVLDGGDGVQPPGSGEPPGDADEFTPGRNEGPIAGSGGGLFVTGREPDSHVVGNSKNLFPESMRAGQEYFIRRSVAYVTPGKAAPRLLFVTSANGGTYEALKESGFKHKCPPDGSMPPDASRGCYDVATDDSGGETVTGDFRNDVTLDDSLDFYAYDAIVIGTLSSPAHGDFVMEILAARSDELIQYVNSGGGLVVFNNSTSGGVNSFLPFSHARRFEHPLGGPSFGFTPTPEGRALGLSEAELNGIFPVRSWFESCGVEALERYLDGRIATFGTHGQIPPPSTGFCSFVSDVSVEEGNHGTKKATFLVTAEASRDEPLNVRYSTREINPGNGGDAEDKASGGADCRGANDTQGPDYVNSEGTLTFAPGETGPKPVVVDICGDTKFEPRERFLLELSSQEDPSHRTSATGSILNDDGALPEDNRFPAPGSAAAAGGQNASQVPPNPPAPLQAGAPAAAPAPAAALPALAPAPATAQSTSQAQVSSHAPSQSQAQASSGSQAPQFGLTMDKERQSQVERAEGDTAGNPSSELLASARRPDPLPAVAATAIASLIALALGAVMRRGGNLADKETISPYPSDEGDPQQQLQRRRAREQR